MDEKGKQDEPGPRAIEGMFLHDIIKDAIESFEGKAHANDQEHLGEDRVAVVNDNGLDFPLLHSWVKNESKQALLGSDGKSINRNDADALARQFLRKENINLIQNFEKVHLVLLSERIWDLFLNVSLEERIIALIKGLLPLTSMDPGTGAMGEKSDDLPANDSRRSPLLEFIEMAMGRGNPRIMDALGEVLEKKVEYTRWTRSYLAVLDKAARNVEGGLRENGRGETDGSTNEIGLSRSRGKVRGLNLRVHLEYVVASVLRKVKRAAQRKAFYPFVRAHPASPLLVEALLHAGSVAPSLAYDILDVLDDMDPDVVRKFLEDEARTVHLNYFFRSFTSVRGHAARSPGVAAIRKKSRGKSREKQRETGAGGSKNHGRAGKTGRDAMVDVDLLEDKYDPRFIRYLLMSNPWDLQKQLVSWQKRISENQLIGRRVDLLKSALSQALEMKRRAMIFSPEFSRFIEKRWKDDEILAKNSVKRVDVFPDELGSCIGEMEGYQSIRDLLKEILVDETGEPISISVFTITGKPRIPGIFPRSCKERPWILVKKGKLLGVGLSGLRLKELPDELRHVDSIRVLDLSNNIITKIPDLVGLETTKILDLSRNVLHEFKAGGARLPSLITLDLHCNHLKTIDIQGAGDGLFNLDVSRNVLPSCKKIVGLESCNKLAALNLTQNLLRSLDGLPGLPALPRLTWLFAEHNKMVRLDLLGNQYNIKHLYLSNNLLGGLKTIQNASRLISLKVDCNYLKSLKGLESLPRLRVFSARSNQLEDPGNLFSIENLEFYDLRWNPLTRVKDSKKRASLLLSPGVSRRKKS